MNIKYLVKDGSGDLYVPIYPFHQETYELAGGGPGSGSLVNKKLRIAVTVNIADESVTYTLLLYNYYAFFSEIEVLGERHTFPIAGQNAFTWQFDKPGEHTFYVTLRPNLPDNVGSPALGSIGSIITSISLPYGIETIPQSLFATMNMPNVDVIVPSSVKRLNAGQFLGCNLHKLVIPKDCVVGARGISGCGPEILEFHGTYIDAETVPFGLTGSGYLAINPTRLKKLIIDCRNTRIVSCLGISVCEEIEVSGNVETILGGCFSGCSLVKKVTLSGNKLKEIQGGAFANCYSLVDISIADSVEDIQSGCFYGCTSLKYIKLPSSLKILKSGVFTNGGAPLEMVVLPEGLLEILSGAFAGISTLKNVNIPSTITIIPYLCFAGSGLLNIDIPNSIITIGSAAFAGSQLVEINIPNSVTTIEGGAFSSCKLQKIYVPNSVVNVGDTIFYGNHNTLEEVYIDSNAITSYNSGSYHGVYRSLFPPVFGSSSYVNIKKVELGPHVTTIGTHAFYLQYPNPNYKQKVEIIFGESVKEIQDNAFRQADPANELDLSHVETIGSYGFYSSFDEDIQKTVRLSNIKSIPYDATFYNIHVENLIIDSPATLNISNNAFYGTIVSDTLHVNSNVTFGESTSSWLDKILNDTYYNVKNIIFGDLVHNSFQNMSTASFPAHRACEYVHFGKNILGVPKYMFQGNTNLTTIEHCLIKVCEGAFSGCTALQSFNTSTIKIYDKESFRDSNLGGVIQIPSDGSAGYWAFYNTNITRFICEGMIFSSAYPLTNCKDLEYILVNSDLNNCVNYNFSQLVSLKTVVTNDRSLAYLKNFPALETVKMINPNVTFYLNNGDVFNNSPKLKDIYIYNRIAPSLGGSIFNGCAENVKVHVPANAIGYEAWVDGSTQWYRPYQLHWEIVKDLDPVYEKLVVYHDIQNISTPTTILTNYDNSVKSIIIDDRETISEIPQGNVTYLFDTVGQHVIKIEFNNPATVGNNAPLLYQLTTPIGIEIPDTFTAIGSAAFNGCSNVTGITIGSNITSIGAGAFVGCSNLLYIRSRIMNAPSVSNGTFQNVKSGGKLYVPINSSGYETWMNDQGNLGLYNWTKVIDAP